MNFKFGFISLDMAAKDVIIIWYNVTNL